MVAKITLTDDEILLLKQSVENQFKCANLLHNKCTDLEVSEYADALLQLTKKINTAFFSLEYTTRPEITLTIKED